MTARELKRLGRSELLEMLLLQVEENEAIRRELEEAKAMLRQRAIVHESSGSIAEAALKISGVFDQAQQAADDYLESIRLANAEPEEFVRKVRQEAQEQADAIIAEAERRSARIHAEADEYWCQMRQKVQGLLHNS